MKIAIAIQDLNMRGGTHKQVLRLSQYLKKNGHDITIISKYVDLDKTYGDFQDFTIISGTKRLARPRQKIIRNVLSLIASWKLARRVASDFDVLNIHDSGFGIFYLLVKILGYKNAVVWQINDLPDCFKVGPNISTPERPWYIVYRFFFRWMASSVDAITVNVTKNRERVEKSMGVSAEVLYCGTDPSFSGIVVRANVPRRHIRLLSIGVFFPYRNYEVILEAQKLLWSEHGISSELTIVGSTSLSPDYGEAIRLLAQKMAINCQILGGITESNLRHCFLENDIFLFVNIDQSWGLSVFEAMNASLPVIVSDSVGAVELLRDGFDADIVDPKNAQKIADCLFRLSSNGDFYVDRSRCAFLASQEMTWDKLYCQPMEAILSRA